MLQLLPTDFAGAVVAHLRTADMASILPSIVLMPSTVVRGWLHCLKSLNLKCASPEDTCTLLSFLLEFNNLQVLHLNISGKCGVVEAKGQPAASTKSDSNNVQKVWYRERFDGPGVRITSSE